MEYLLNLDLSVSVFVDVKSGVEVDAIIKEEEGLKYYWRDAEKAGFWYCRSKPATSLSLHYDALPDEIKFAIMLT